MKCLMELDSAEFALTWKEKLAYLGYRFAEVSEDPKKIGLKHIFEPGWYIREMTIPAETLFIGRPHLVGHGCKLIEGKILMITEGGQMHMEAPVAIHTEPGYMMCLYSKTPVIGRTYHPNPDNRHDVEAMQADIFGPIAELVALGESVDRKIRAIEGKR